MDENTPTTKDLNELKKLIDQEIRPLISRLQSPVDRHHAYMSLLRNEWDVELAYKAFHEAQKIENAEDKFFSLQSLSSEIYYHDQDLKSSMTKES